MAAVDESRESSLKVLVLRPFTKHVKLIQICVFSRTEDSFFLFTKPWDFLVRKFESVSHTGRQIRLHALSFR